MSVAVRPDAGTARRSAEAARERALSHLSKGEYVPALAAYDEALASARAAEDPAFLDWIFACRAFAAVEVGTADADLVELKEILLRRTDPPTALRASYALSTAYHLRRDLKKALFYSRLARAHARATGEPAAISHSLNQVGLLLAASSEFDEAASAFEEALQTTPEGTGDVAASRAKWKDNLGYCRISLGRHEEGVALVHEAVEELRKAGAEDFLLYPLMDLCLGYLLEDRYEEARFFGEAALERLEKSGPLADVAAEKNLLYLLGEACHLGGDEEAAETCFGRLARHYPDFKNLRAYLEVFDLRNVINLRT